MNRRWRRLAPINTEHNFASLFARIGAVVLDGGLATEEVSQIKVTQSSKKHICEHLCYLWLTH
jgi:hypothetical protein